MMLRKRMTFTHQVASLDRLNTQDLRRLNHDAEYDIRFVLTFEFLQMLLYLF